MNGYCLLALGSNVEGENKSHDPQDQTRGISSQAIFYRKAVWMYPSAIGMQKPAE